MSHAGHQNAMQTAVLRKISNVVFIASLLLIYAYFWCRNRFFFKCQFLKYVKEKKFTVFHRPGKFKKNESFQFHFFFPWRSILRNRVSFFSLRGPGAGRNLVCTMSTFYIVKSIEFPFLFFSNIFQPQ